LSSQLRKLASKLLQAVVRRTPGDSQCWGNAMLRELDFVETDWAALWWALGSAAAIFRHSIPREVAAWVGKQSGWLKQETLRSMARKATGLGTGVVISISVSMACIFGLTHVSPFLFPELHLAQMRWAQYMSVLWIPETIFVMAAVALWRRRRAMSVGILVSAITLMTHFMIYVSTHG
jgi:hypothetical protein